MHVDKVRMDAEEMGLNMSEPIAVSPSYGLMVREGSSLPCVAWRLRFREQDDDVADHSRGQAGEGPLPGQFRVHSVVQKVL